MYGTMATATQRMKRKRKRKFRPTKWCRTPFDKYLYIFLVFVVIYMVVQAFRAPSGFWTGTYVPTDYIKQEDTGRLYDYDDYYINEIYSVSTGKTQENVVTTPEPVIRSLGEFRLTAYCPCIKCCGKWSHEHPQNQYDGFIQKTASGAIPKENHTIAADWNVLPKGSKVLINGTEYLVEDKGGVVTDNRIDIFFEDHKEALAFGVQYAEIFIIE